MSCNVTSLLQIIITFQTHYDIKHHSFYKGTVQTEQDDQVCSMLQYTNYYFAAILIYAGIFKQSVGARNRGGIGLSYRPASLRRLVELIDLNQVLDSP
jgi:hypothetical protein